ncbi:hypothetical protein Vadar_030231 [Vaccinium darrowii]|uniref:Uncharacterized protein n=1 Tax=Vaccinium darrowii TaxID=229202 RepID=A0ACB7Z1J0_9ERIC|nr:hypothetical protein Vadar_030231 [Vaccinium darrowii]
MNWVDHDGKFLLSNNSVFALQFYNGLDVASFVLVVIHMRSSKVVWTANRGLLVRNTDKFVFDKNGNAYLENATSVVWSTDTKGKGVTSMELLDTGNLVLLGDNRRILWQSFSHPTDTLLSGQEFVEGMMLKSFPSQHKLYHYLEIKSNDVILYAGYRTPQVYWTMATDNFKNITKTNGTIFSASIVANSWNFFDRNKILVWQFRFLPFNDVNATWAVVLGTDGSISFINLERGVPPRPEPLKIPQNPCGIPEPCNPYVVCSFDIRCQCPLALSSHPDCMPKLDIPCNSSQSVVKMSYIGEKLNYFALGFVAPVLKTHLNGCKDACIRNCSCRVLFFENTSGNCFLFDQIGSLQRADSGSSGFTAYIKVQIENGTKGKNHVAIIVIISVATVLVITGLLYLGFRFVSRKNKLPERSEETSDEDNFLDNVSGMPIIGGRKNYDPGEISEKAHFPSYAFKMMEEGKLKDIFDPDLDVDKNDERVIAAMRVALWCIQDEMHMRPPMSKVVQMLEGLCAVPEPPTSVQMTSRLYSSFFKSSSEEGTSSGLTNINSIALLSDVELSGPR